MIDLKKDKKGPTYILTKIDKEGFHRQMNLTKGELKDLFGILKRIKL